MARAEQAAPPSQNTSTGILGGSRTNSQPRQGCSWNISSQASHQLSKAMSNFHSQGGVPEVTCAPANLPATELAWGTQHRFPNNY